MGAAYLVFSFVVANLSGEFDNKMSIRSLIHTARTGGTLQRLDFSLVYKKNTG
jgi:hypothetical protein